MTVISSVGQQWHKAQLAEKLSGRLQTESIIRQLLTGATSLDTVSNLVVALASSEQELDAEAWHDGVMVALFFSAYRLLFVKATQQQLSQGEELIISIGSRLSQCVSAEMLDAGQQQQLALMQQLSQQLVTLRNQRRSQHRNMC
ncbi:hypothetical protein KDN34_16550 [Shewanella yunxiaonensis]|uniref:Uncharacterized protein n=1 Tax=Shewanella yunxiaonensis TaxID=2829809 RepID=A0ABX7YSJ2_9GAMM|nr:hypothetical protein [Shewanella yunxiaonensis]QUN05763.1 hypothetical protein KDN34_16550 [Shewanella yunxiaonensis]